jgi:hypothetical protein
MLIAEMVAYLMVLVCCVYRWVVLIALFDLTKLLSSQMIFSLPEMAAGWGSSLMRNEREFMVFVGA